MFASKDFFQGTTAPSTYSIARSVRFRASASAYLNRTPASASNRTTWTWSSWVKIGSLTQSASRIFDASTGSPIESGIVYNKTANEFRFEYYNGSSYTTQCVTAAVFRDPASWYHLVVSVDTTQATAANRVIIYVNGVTQTLSTATYPAQNAQFAQNSTGTHCISRFAYAAGNYFDGYLTEINFIDGQQLTSSSFGAINSYGVWAPTKYTGTYGTNGFYLNFSDNSGATATTIGKDYSGNGNNWTPNNISVTAGVTYDSMIDTPTPAASATQPVGNYAVLNPISAGTGTSIIQGNLSASYSTTPNMVAATVAAPITGKWYWEIIAGTTGDLIGIVTAATDTKVQNYPGDNANGYGYNSSNGQKYNNASGSAYGATYTTNDVIGVALDISGGTLTFYKNNVSQGVAFSGLSGSFLPASRPSNTGTQYWNFGQRPFSYTPPSGYQALCTANLATPTIANGAGYMAATTYTGTGATQTIANTVNSKSFKPDLVWIKSRSAATNNNLFDSVRGTTNYLISNSTAANATNANTLTAFGSTGFTLGSDASSIGVNVNAATYVAWQWLGSNTTVSNTSGSITSTVCVNTTSGFSVVTYTGTGAAATVGHGLGVAPSMVIVRNMSDGAVNWRVYHISIGATNFLSLNLTNASAAASSVWNNTTPTSSVFSVANDGGSNESANSMVAYCFAPITGFSAFGSYTGNGSTDGPFVYLGFRPRWVLIKRTDSTSDWYIWDTARDTYNVVTNTLLADTAGAETSATSIDDLSNGFKCRSSTVVNASSGTYIYAAFAENPFNYSLAR